MIGSSRIAPASLLFAITLAVVPMLLPGGLLDGGASAAAAGPAHPAPRSALVVHLTLPPLKLAPLSLPVRHVQPVHPAITTHTVVAGDTLWELANAAGLTVAEIAAANDLSEDATLQLGQVLRVPARGTAPAMARAAAAGSPGPSAPVRRWPAECRCSGPRPA